MTHTNVLNRKHEEVYGVGKEFKTVAELWGVSPVVRLLLGQLTRYGVEFQWLDTDSRGEMKLLSIVRGAALRGDLVKVDDILAPD